MTSPPSLAVGVVDLADAVVRDRSPGRPATDRGSSWPCAATHHAFAGARAAGGDRGQLQRLFLDRLGADVVLGDVLAERLAGDGGAIELAAGPAGRG